MKKMILSVATIAFITGSAFAQNNTATAPPADNPQAQAAVTKAEPQKKQVTEAELPEGIKKALTADQYKEWKLASAWQIMEGKTEYYVLEMAKGDEKTTLKLNKDGQAI